MKAVVMAGGEGSRLRPLTIGRPKPMVPVVQRPAMGHILYLLKQHGIQDVVVTVQYMAEVIQDYFGDGSQWGMSLQYAVEETPLGTAGSVKNAQALLDEPFLVISGDALTDFNLSEVVRFHEQMGAVATLTLYRVPNPLEYGVVITDAKGRITQFLEKPSWGEVISDTVNTGIYVLQPEVLEDVPRNEPFDFAKDLFPILLKRGAPLYGYVASGYWTDIGNIQEYIRACEDLLEGRVRLDPPGQPLDTSVWAGGEVEIAPDARLYGPVYLGDGVKIKQGVVIHGPAVVDDSTIVDSFAHIDRSIVWWNSYVGESAELRGTIVCRQVSIKSKVVTFEGAVIGDGTMLDEGAVIHAGVKIWPGKVVEAGATVKSSIIWGSQGRRTLFGRYGVTGLVNVDLTPEFAAKLGAAFGATLPKGATVTMNRDPHRSPRMLKRAIIAGLPSAGVHVLDLRTMPIPVARYFTRTSGAAGGVHVRLSPYDQRVVDIRFMDSQGLNLSKSAERNIERVFFREDFRRVYLDEIGTIEYAPLVVERYREGFLKVVDVERIRARQFRVVVDYAHAPNSLVLPDILNALGVRQVPLNARIDESKMSVPEEELGQALQQLAVITGALGMDLGVRLDVGGEKVFWVDDKGVLVDPKVVALAMVWLALRAKGGGVVAVPVTAPNAFEQVAAAHGGRILRTKADLHALMQAAAQEGVMLATDANGHYIFPDFQPAADGMMAIARLLEYLAVQGETLSTVAAHLPAFHMAVRTVPCPWEAKGKVMRQLNEQFKDYRSDSLDGVKVFLQEDEWVLVLPDPDNPRFYLYAEAPTEKLAQDLAEKYSRVVQSLQE